MTFNIDIYLDILIKKKPEDLALLDLKKLNAITDFFIICHAKTNRQVTAMAEYVKLDLKKRNIRPISFEGFKEGNWAILDYGEVVIHVFHETFRKIYDLEELWKDAIISRINQEKINNLNNFHSISYKNIDFETNIID